MPVTLTTRGSRRIVSLDLHRKFSPQIKFGEFSEETPAIAGPSGTQMPFRIR
jgi:hypothetical protein